MINRVKIESGHCGRKMERRHLKDHSLGMHKGLPVIEKNTNQMFRTSGVVVAKTLKLKKLTKYILEYLSLHRLKLYCKTMVGLLDTALSNHWTTGQ